MTVDTTLNVGRGRIYSETFKQRLVTVAERVTLITYISG